MATNVSTAGLTYYVADDAFVGDTTENLSTAFHYVTSVNMKATGATSLGVVPSGCNQFVPTAVTIVCMTADTVAVVAALSIGTNSASYNNILAISTLTGLTTANQCFTVPLVAVATSPAAGTEIFVKVTTGATATTQTANIYVTGFYR